MLAALEAGYRSIDTAAIYGNEEGIGAGARRLRARPRRALRHHQGVERRPGLRLDAARVRRSLAQAGPRLRGPLPDPLAEAEPATRTSRRGAPSRRSYADGRARAIGVSNFQPAHLRRLLDETRVVPAVNQIELHPQLAQASCAPSTPSTASPPRRGRRSGQGKGLLDDPVDRRDRRAARPHPGPGGAALAPPAGQRRDPEVRDAVPDPGEHRRVRLRAGRRRTWRRSPALDTGTRLGPDPDERETRRRPGVLERRRWMGSDAFRAGRGDRRRASRSTAARRIGPGRLRPRDRVRGSARAHRTAPRPRCPAHRYEARLHIPGDARADADRRADDGPLLDSMLITDGRIPARLVQPRVEPEIAVVLGPDRRPAAVHAALEVVDSVWCDYRFTLELNTADGSSAAGVALVYRCRSTVSMPCRCGSCAMVRPSESGQVPQRWAIRCAPSSGSSPRWGGRRHPPAR